MRWVRISSTKAFRKRRKVSESFLAEFDLLSCLNISCKSNSVSDLFLVETNLETKPFAHIVSLARLHVSFGCNNHNVFHSTGWDWSNVFI